MVQYEQLIYNTNLLKDIEKEQIALYFEKQQFKFITYMKGTVVHLENDSCKNLEIILFGKVVVERLDESGGILTVAEFNENDILGGNLLFSNKPYYPMTITTKQETIILEIAKDVVFDLCGNNIAFLKTFLEYISDHTTMLSFKIKQHINKTIRESLLIFLEHEVKKQSTNRIRLNMTKKELADKIGVQRTSLSRELSKMKKDGLIDFDIETITILSINDSTN